MQQLIGVRQTTPAPAVPVESYTYDPAGNRIASHLSSAPIQVDDANRTLDDGVNAYSWTDNGALASRTPKSGGAALTFSYDWFGIGNQSRLKGVNGVVGFYYDPLGRLFATAWDASGPGAARGNIDTYNDGPDRVLELRNVFGGSQRQWARYVHGPGDDQILAMELYPAGADPTPGTGTIYYYHPDGEGSVRLLSDASGNVANRYDYDSFGRRINVVESAPQPYGWKGREFLPEIGLVYNRARFYDPVLGRFTTEDPIGYDGGDTNLYNFGWNNPKNWNDPSGFSAAAEEEETDSVALSSAASLALIGARIACVFSALADVFASIEEDDYFSTTVAGVDLAQCVAKPVRTPKPKPRPIKRINVTPTSCPWKPVSFEGDTVIEALDRAKKISEIAVGDLVAARDEFTGEKTYRPVTHLFRRTAPGIVHLTLENQNASREVLNVTSEHP